jgi:hypothetical protein
VGQTITVSPSATTTYFVAGYNSFNCRGIGQVDVVVDANACSGSSTARASGTPAQSTTTSEPTIAAEDIAVYPNPSNGIFYIKNAPKNGEVQIYNQMGQRISSGVIESTDEPLQINLMQQVRGIYFVRISQSNKPLYQGRITKIE